MLGKNSKSWLVILAQIAKFPLLSIVTTIVFATAFFSAVLFYLLLHNETKLEHRWNISSKISLYLKKATNTKVANDLVVKLNSNSLVDRAYLVAPEEGIKVFKENVTLDAFLASFKYNPLPSVIVIYPQVRYFTDDITSKFVNELKGYGEVEDVDLNVKWIKQGYSLLHGLTKVLTALFWGSIINLFLVFFGGSYFIARHLVNKKIFVNLLSGQFLVYGFFGSILALIGVRWFLMAFYDAGIVFSGLSLFTEFLVMIFGSLVAFVGARIAN